MSVRGSPRPVDRSSMQNKKKSRWPKLWIVILAAAGAGAGGYYYFRKADSPALDFRTSPISRGDIIQTVTANGNLSPVVDVEVGTQV